MTVQLTQRRSHDLFELVRLECRTFSVKLRTARAALGWSQSELAFRAGLTQRAIHKLEQGETQPRLATIRALEHIWANEGLAFEHTEDGGFRLTVGMPVIERPNTTKTRRRRAVRQQLGVTRLSHA